MSFWRKEVQEIINLDNTNDNLKDWEKNNIEVNLNSKEWKLKQYLATLKWQKKLLEEWKEVLDWNLLLKSLREVLYEIAFLEDTKISLDDLKSDIDNWNELDINRISKYTLSNYESLPIWESYGVSKSYRDLDKPIETSDWFIIEGYIDYVSIVDWEINHKKLVILDSINWNKDDKISDKVVYSISDKWELILEENFQIERDWIHISENRGYISPEQNKKYLELLKKEVPNYKEKWEVIDEEIEETLYELSIKKKKEELKNKILELPAIKPKIKKILSKILLNESEGVNSQTFIDFLNLESYEFNINDETFIWIYKPLSLEEWKELLNFINIRKKQFEKIEKEILNKDTNNIKKSFIKIWRKLKSSIYFEETRLKKD